MPPRSWMPSIPSLLSAGGCRCAGDRLRRSGLGNHRSLVAVVLVVFNPHPRAPIILGPSLVLAARGLPTFLDRLAGAVPSWTRRPRASHEDGGRHASLSPVPRCSSSGGRHASGFTCIVPRCGAGSGVVPGAGGVSRTGGGAREAARGGCRGQGRAD